MYIYDWLQKNNLSKEAIEELFAWVESHPDNLAEGRRQLGYYDGYTGCKAISVNPDYLRGYEQGKAMRS